MERPSGAVPDPPTLTLRTYRAEHGAHAHDHAQVLIGRTGLLELEVDGRAHFVDAACGLVVPAGAGHSYGAAAPACLLVLDSPPARGLDRCRRFVLPPRLRQRSEVVDGTDGLDAWAVLQALPGSALRLERRPVRLATLDAAIDADLAGAWSTGRLAALCHLSPQRFHARFVELAGCTPAEHVRRRRLAAARRRLQDGWPLESTALHVGYRSASALGHALRRDCGVGARGLRRAG